MLVCIPVCFIFVQSVVLPTSLWASRFYRQGARKHRKALKSWRHQAPLFASFHIGMNLRWMYWSDNDTTWLCFKGDSISDPLVLCSWRGRVAEDSSGVKESFKIRAWGVKLILFICDVIKHSRDRLLSLESQSRLSKMQRRLEKCP